MTIMSKVCELNDRTFISGKLFGNLGSISMPKAAHRHYALHFIGSSGML